MSEPADVFPPGLVDTDGPAYRRIADTIADAITDGRLARGDRLPTHRALARQLGLAVPTISRAYREAEQRGLIDSTVGRGTFVAGIPTLRSTTPQRPLDLSVNAPARGEHGQLLRAALAAAATDPAIDRSLGYSADIGAVEDRLAAAEWLAAGGLHADPDRIALCAGGQHAILVAVGAVLRPGQTLLTDALTYPGVRSAAQTLGVKITGVAADEEGLSPDALAAACAANPAARALYCMPTAHNPTTTTWSATRRRAVLDVARRYDLAVIEDDVFGLLEPAAGRETLAALAPDRTLHLTSLSKTLTPGLRWGAVVAPGHLVDRIGGLVRATVFNPSPVAADIARRWLTDGTATALLAWQRTEMGARFAATHQILGRCAAVSAVRTAGLHAWVQLCPPWTPADVVETAARHDISLGATTHFHADVASAAQPHSQGIRVCVGNAPHLAALTTALGTLAAAWNTPPTWASGTRV